MTPETLADLRSRLPDCELAVYVDMRSGTVLGADGALRYPQEYLDALGNAATRLFAGGPTLDGAEIGHALFRGPTGSRAFLRSPAEAAEALCFLCAPDADMARLLREGRAALGEGKADR